MDLHLKDKVVVVTGGSEGIGKAIVLEFLKENCKVAVVARRQEVLDELLKECAGKGFGGNITAFSADVTDAGRMAEVCAAVVAKFGRLDVWINNAGKSLRKGLMDVSLEEWNQALNVNLTSAFICSKLAATEMRKTGGGVIINCTSFATSILTAGIGSYGVAKNGLRAMTDIFAAELAADNIRVIAYAPGLIETPLTAPRVAANRGYLESQIALKRLGTPEDIAPAVVFLCSEQASYFTGTEVVIAGGKFCVQNPMYSWDK